MNPSIRKKYRTLDIRPLMQTGEHPLPRILAATSALATGDILTLVTPFLPSPLIEKLQSEGFEARPERRADGSWQTQVSRPEPG
jgi:uncharacterized protein (DUF2249 family)